MHVDCSRREAEEEGVEEKLDEPRSSRRRRKGLDARSARADIKGRVFQPLDKQSRNGTTVTHIKSGFSPTAARMLSRVTKGLVELYRTCNPQFSFNPESVPRKVLTEPHVKAGNGGADNEQSNLILSVNDVLKSDQGPSRSYRVSAMLGEGTFGQVVKCEDSVTHKWVAVKVIKNNPAYHNQAIVELGLLQLLNAADKDDTGHIVRLIDHFAHKNHLCLVFEMLGMNLYEFVKSNSFRGMSCNLVRAITKQMLEAMMILRDANVIHCDLKPENVLFVRSGTSAIKLIDFGSACMDMQTIYSYVQSRFYRSPEVLLGLPYDAAIDMWSLGCIIAELFIGLPVFPGQTQHNQITRIVKLLGLPDSRMLERGTPNIRKFFNAPGDPYPPDDGEVFPAGRKCDVYMLKSAKQFARETNTEEVQSKKYFNGEKLDDILLQYPFKRSLDSEGRAAELKTRESLLHFLKGLLRWEPHLRWTPKQAIEHPFITGAPLSSFQEVEEPPVEMWAVHSPEYMGELELQMQAANMPYVGSYADDPLRPRVSEVHNHYQQHHAQFRDGNYPDSYSPPSRCGSGQISPYYYDLAGTGLSDGRFRPDYRHWDEAYFPDGRLSRGSTDSLPGRFSETRQSYSENQRYSVSESELSPTMRGRTSVTSQARAFLRVPGLGVDTSPVQTRSSRSSSDDASVPAIRLPPAPPPRSGKSKSLNEGKSYLSPYANSFEQLTVSPQLATRTHHKDNGGPTPNFRILPPLHVQPGYVPRQPTYPQHPGHHHHTHHSPTGRHPRSYHSPSPSRMHQHQHGVSPSRTYPAPPPTRPYSNNQNSTTTPPFTSQHASGIPTSPHSTGIPPLILNPNSNPNSTSPLPRGRPRPAAGSPER